MARNEVVLELASRQVTITNPTKIFFPHIGKTKMDLVQYYLSVSEGALRGVRNRPMVLKRYVDGAGAEPFFQKRAPANRPDWMKTCNIRLPSGRTADEIVVRTVPDLIWVINLGCIDLNPWAIRAHDTEHPDELRIDLDPTPQADFDMVREVALTCRDVLVEQGLVGYPKTSGSRGIHINVRIEQLWKFAQVRRAALVLAREVERRLPDKATSKWWKEERHGVFIDYNQNARDRTVASAYSVHAMPDARVSCPLTWDEVSTVDPAAWTIDTVPQRFAAMGDPSAAIDAVEGSLRGLLQLSADDEARGEGDAAWPPNFPKMEGEPPRVQPSKRRKGPQLET